MTIQSASRLLLYGAVWYAVAINLTCNKIRRVFCMTWYAKIVLMPLLYLKPFPSFWKIENWNANIWENVNPGYMNWLSCHETIVTCYARFLLYIIYINNKLAKSWKYPRILKHCMFLFLHFLWYTECFIFVLYFLFMSYYIFATRVALPLGT